MEITYKNARQEEFAGLMQTAETAGYRAVDLARWIGVTPGAVSQYRAGTTTPKESVLQLLRRHIEEKITAKRHSDTTPADLMKLLLDLERLDPDRFEVARANIETLHNQLDKSLVHGPKPPASSGEVRGAVKLLKKASASLNKRGGGQSS